MPDNTNIIWSLYIHCGITKTEQLRYMVCIIFRRMLMFLHSTTHQVISAKLVHVDKYICYEYQQMLTLSSCLTISMVMLWENNIYNFHIIFRLLLILLCIQIPIMYMKLNIYQFGPCQESLFIASAVECSHYFRVSICTW